MKTIFIDRFNARGKWYKTVYSHTSLAQIIKTKQGKKDVAGRYGLYSYAVNGTDFERLVNSGFSVYAGSFDSYSTERV